MAIERRYYQVGSEPTKCFEFDEYAVQDSDRYYEIDCSLPSPTRKATPVPDFAVFEVYYWILRYNEFLRLQKISDDLNYFNVDAYIADHPEDNFLSNEAETARASQVVALVAAIAEEDKEPLAAWFKENIDRLIQY